MAGQELCVATMGNIFGALTKDAKKATLKWAQDTMLVSQSYYVPIQTGNLHDSAKVYVYKENFLEYQVKMGYNENGKAPYAVYVHQIPRLHRHGYYNFLATPYHMRSPELVSSLDDIRLGGK